MEKAEAGENRHLAFDSTNNIGFLAFLKINVGSSFRSWSLCTCNQWALVNVF